MVRELKRLLVERGLKVWLDMDELIAGTRWPGKLEDGILSSASVAVLISEDGLGPWERQEMEAALLLATQDGRPLIPVIMPGGKRPPRVPPFLGTRIWVDFSEGYLAAAMEQFIQGIKVSRESSGPQPGQEHIQGPGAAKGPNKGQTFRCRVNCLGKDNDCIHSTNGAYIVQLCKSFPNTDFKIYNNESGDPVDPLSIIALMTADIHHGDEVQVVVSGEMEVVAAECLRITLENIADYSDNISAGRLRLRGLLDAIFSRIYDPDVADAQDLVKSFIKNTRDSSKEEYRLVAVVNDRLHDVSLPMIPLIAKHFDCSLCICFELPNSGIHSFHMTSSNGFALDDGILELDIGVGTRITVIARGSRKEAAARAVADVLQNLWQCDVWFRRKYKGGDAEALISELISYAREIGRTGKTQYDYVRRPFITHLLFPKHVFINAAGTPFSKDLVVQQLAQPHAELHKISLDSIIDCVKETESKISVPMRPGFALLHAAMDWGPRISISFGVYPEGVFWETGMSPAKLVAMFVCAKDTHRTWRDYLKRLAVLFRTNHGLFVDLISAASPDRFRSILREAEVSLSSD